VFKDLGRNLPEEPKPAVFLRMIKGSSHTYTLENETPGQIAAESILAYHGSMKTTVDIPEKALSDAMRFAGAKTKREAIVTAIEDYNRRKSMAELVKYSGTSETLLSNEAIEDLERKRARRLEKLGK